MVAISLSGSAVNFSLTGKKREQISSIRHTFTVKLHYKFGYIPLIGSFDIVRSIDLLKAREWSGFLIPLARSLCNSTVDDCCITR